MEFNIIYQKYNKIIHYLLTRYQITYNYDEFYQLLLIQMWHLSNNYKPSKSNKFSSYLFIRLNYYLIDIFRKESNKIKTSDIDDYISSEIEPYQHINNESLLIQDIHYLLNSKEKEWLLLKLSGYKQYEIAERMHLSLTTIKKLRSQCNLKSQNIYIILLKRNETMNHLTTTNLLYIQTEISDKLSTKWQYKQYDISLPISINNTLDYMLELHQKTLPLQKKIAKRLLHINKKFLFMYVINSFYFL